MKSAQLVALGATTNGGQIDLNNQHIATMLANGDCVLTPAGDALFRSGSFTIGANTVRLSRSVAAVETVAVESARVPAVPTSVTGELEGSTS